MTRHHAIAGCVAAIAACRGAAADRTARDVAALAAVDGDGDTVRLTRAARRVVSLVPSATDVLVALGATPELVGRTRYDHNPAVAAVASVGGAVDPDLERLLALDPDLVIGWDGTRQAAMRQMLTAHGLPLYVAPTRDTAAFFGSTMALGHLVGHDSMAVALSTRLRAELAAVRASVAGRPIHSVLFVIWGDPPMTVGPHTFIAELIGVAGGRNAFDDATTDWPRVSMEAIVRRAPDIVILSVGEHGTRGAEHLREEPGWRVLPAVRAGRVTDVPADLTNRPGPRIGAVARLFRDAIHPEAARPDSAIALIGVDVHARAR